jgi:hypothetical protein
MLSIKLHHFGYIIWDLLRLRIFPMRRTMVLETAINASPITSSGRLKPSAGAHV